MTLREILNVIPGDQANLIELHYFDLQGTEFRDLFIFTLVDADSSEKFGAIMLEHYAEDEVLELSHICRGYTALQITVDREVKQETVRKWKTKAADQAGMLHILRDWEDDE